MTGVGVSPPLVGSCGSLLYCGVGALGILFPSGSTGMILPSGL